MTLEFQSNKIKGEFMYMMNKERIEKAFISANTDYGIENVLLIDEVSQNAVKIAAEMRVPVNVDSKQPVITENGQNVKDVEFTVDMDAILSQIFELHDRGDFIAQNKCYIERHKIRNIQTLHPQVNEDDVRNHFEQYPELIDEAKQEVMDVLSFKNFRISTE